MIVLTILKYIALGVLASVGLAVLLLWVFRKKIFALLKSLGEKGRVPVAVTLVELDEEPEWLSGDEVRRISRNLTDEGFESIGYFCIPELGASQMAAFMLPGENITACVYDHDGIDPTFEMGFDTMDGREVDATSTEMGKALDKPDWVTRLYLPGAGCTEMLRRMREAARGEALRPVEPENFKRMFEAAYEQQRLWTLSRGGYTREEIRAEAETSGESVSDEQVEEIYQAMREGYLLDLQEACVRQYFRETEIDPEEGEDEQVFAIPEQISCAEMKALLEEELDLLNDEVLHSFNQLTNQEEEPVGAHLSEFEQGPFAGMNIRRVGEVGGPIPAAIYRMPESAW